MSGPSWNRIKDLLHQAMQLAPEQRPAFLDEACASEPALRSEVESLLAAGEEVNSRFMQSPPLPDGDADAQALAAGALAEGQIFAERFLLVRKLGEGGMGQVWLADQTLPVRRQVALKLIKAGMYDESVVQRFQSERQSLAIMDHPAIAKVFDAGTTPQGQPYFVMEYVPGLPITEYCDQKKLRIADRLELFIQACDGVQHAHQKAIIHRDLKPANILVVEVDGKPTPRIIDFGLAKAATPRLGDESLFTQRGFFVGTPGYMSPEQADPSVRDIDTRTDVYSLGVVLYVLLAGVQPFDSKAKQKPSLDELLRKLREEEPPRPSSKVSSERSISAATAEARGTEPKQLVRMLRGDLDWITLMALEKDRARRYGTPSELAADLHRSLRHEPVIARPANAGYQLRKYVRRHRVAVAAVASLLLLLTAFTVLQAVELRRITRERDRANRERDRATRITDFMTGMFKVSDPGQARGNTVTAREILDKASNDMGAGLARDPEVRSQMMQVMASTYANLGLYARAHELTRQALDARMALLGPDSPMTLESMTQLGLIVNREGHAADAESLERPALDRERRILGPQNPLTLETEDYLASALLYQGHYDESEKLEREVITAATRTMGPESDQALRSTDNLGTALMLQGNYADAEQQFRRLIEAARSVLGPDNPRTLRAMGSLATTIAMQHRFPEAETLDRQVVASDQRVLGPEHPLTADAMESLAYVLSQQSRWAEAEKLYRETYAVKVKTHGRDSMVTLYCQSELALLLSQEHHLKEAEKLQRNAFDTQARIFGPDNIYALESADRLAAILIKEGKFPEAEKLAQQTFDAELRTLGPEHPGTLKARRQLGTAMACNHRYAEASKLFQDAIAKEESLPAQKNAGQAWYDFACVAASAGHGGEALQYLDKAVARGYRDADDMAADEDLKTLRPNPQFQEIVAALKRQPPTFQPQ